MRPTGAFGWRERKASMTGEISSAGAGACRRQGRTLSTVGIVCAPFLVGDEALHLVALEVVPAAEVGELDGEAQAHDLAAQTLDQPDCSSRRAAGGEHVVDDQHPLPRSD